MKTYVTTADKWVFGLLAAFLIFPLLFGYLDVSTCFMNRYLLVFALVVPPGLLFLSRHSPKDSAELSIQELSQAYKAPLPKPIEDDIRLSATTKIYVERIFGAAMLIACWGFLVYEVATSGFALLSC